MKPARLFPGKRRLVLIASVLAILTALFLGAMALRRHLGQRLAERLVEVRRRLVAAERDPPADLDPGIVPSLRAQCSYLQWVLPGRRQSLRIWLFRRSRAGTAFLEKSLDEVEAGRDPLPRVTGVMLRAHPSPVDGGLTTYSLRVPDDYDPAEKWPLVVHLHGRGRLKPYTGHPAPDYGGGLLVMSPFGKGSVDYMEAAERDVLAALDEVTRLYNVDQDRVYLSGSSMGGTGAWHLAAHYPDRFAALVATSANSDDRVWEELWEENVPEPEAGSVRAALERMERLDSPIAYAGNLLHVPSLVIHGEEDAVVPVEHSRNMVARLQDRGARCEYRELVGMGHGIGDALARTDRAEWLLAHRRTVRPEEVRYATDGRWPGAYWVKRVVPRRPLEIAEVTARVTPDGRGVEVATANAAFLVIDLVGAPLSGEGPVAVAVDGCEVGVFPRERVTLASDESKWKRISETEDVRPGEFSAIFRDRFAVIYGTGGDDEKLKTLLRREALRLAGEWRRRYFASPRVYADTNVPEEVLAKGGLVLFGGPSQNAVTARALEELRAAGNAPPFSFEGAAVKVAGETAAGGDPDTLGLQFVWPSPFNREKLIGLVWGASWRSLVEVGGRFGNSFDWTVYENRRWFGYALFDGGTGGPESFLLAGRYGGDWSLDPGLMWKRSERAPGAAPRFFYVSEAPPDKSLWLDELLPVNVNQARGPVGFGRGWGGKELSAGSGGRRFEHGLGMRAPGLATYDLNGGFSRLTATAGADLEGRRPEDLSEPRVTYGVMKFTVRGDGRELFVSEPLGPADAAVDIKVDVSGVRRLELEVLPAGKYQWHLGSAAWGGALLER